MIINNFCFDQKHRLNKSDSGLKHFNIVANLEECDKIAKFTKGLDIGAISTLFYAESFKYISYLEQNLRFYLQKRGQ